MIREYKLKRNKNKSNLRVDRRERIKARIRSKIFGTKTRPRLSIFRSNKHIYAQLINDVKGNTLCSVSDLEIKSKRGTKAQISKEVGVLIAKKALRMKINKAVFDRGGYKYHGGVKALAEGAREGGLKF